MIKCNNELPKEGPKFLVTIKCNSQRFASRDELMNVYENTVKKAVGSEWISRVAFELDRQCRLHLHTIAYFKKKPWFKKFMVKGYTVHFKQIQKDVEKVYQYINKNSHNLYTDQEMEWYSKASFHNLFI